jgi:hypothetical protein
LVYPSDEAAALLGLAEEFSISNYIQIAYCGVADMEQ